MQFEKCCAPKCWVPAWIANESRRQTISTISPQSIHSDHLTPAGFLSGEKPPAEGAGEVAEEGGVEEYDTCDAVTV